MKIIPWEQLPPDMQIEEVKKYYDILKKRTVGLLLKRAFDMVVSLIAIVVLSPVYLILAIAIKLDSQDRYFIARNG